ncbi:YhgE/Pip domain-containing protein [Carnobacterium mobile]|uniref:YhgE/Pip domain-containing protein n=1 Tax=Carnobacterium mobile TaxID=2750 RepID=UPI001868660D|nr:YhgE/Pip domain-containing protein [Carnobacterium mobile]
MEMLKEEWKKISSNKMLMISSIVILFIPILYAGFFLKSNWDPYGNTDKLSVAVVNEDVAVDYEGKKLDVGNEMVENLKTNDALDWHFVSPSEAKKGLKDRKYYMVMTVPRNFSENAATLMDDHPKEMNITYETNGSLNFIGEVISKSAVKEVKSEVSQNVTKAYTEAIFDQIGEVGEGFTEAADGAEELDEGTDKLADGNQEITKNLTKLADSTLTFSDGADTLNVGLKEYTNGVAQVGSGAAQLNEGIGQLASNVGPLKDGVTQLDNGASSLASGLTAYTAGVSQLETGAGQLTANNAKLQNGVASLSGGVDQVKTGSDQLLDGLEEMSGQLRASTENSEEQKELQENLDGLENGLPQINDGIQELKNTLQTQAGGIDTAVLTEDIRVVLSNLGAIKNDLDSLTASKNNLENLSGQINPDTDAAAVAAVDAVKSKETFKDLTPEQSKELEETLKATLNTQYEGQKQIIENSAQEIGTSVEAIQGKTINAGTAATDLANQMSSLEKLTKKLPELMESVNTIAENSKVALPGAAQAINELRSGIAQVQTSVLDALDRTGEGENKGLIQGMTELNQGLATIQSGLKGDNGLVAGITTYTNGVSTLQNGAGQLTNNSSALNSGAAQLSGGINQIAGKLPTLIDGVNQLNNGSSELVQGTNQLTQNSGTLVNGAAQLADGADQINDGSNQLADGSQTLGEGLDTLKDGTHTLATSLQDGADEVNAIDPTDETYTMFSNPTKLTHKEYSHVPNYGAALAPYIMSMALYIGAVVFNTIYPVRKKSLAGQSGAAWWGSKMSVALLSAVLMALIEGGILMLLGLHVQSVGKFFLMAVVAALTFMSIVSFFTIALDNVGRFIAMLLLIVQLGGSGGTFPMPLTNGFFNAIHPFLPMSYSIYGLREAISGGMGQNLYLQSIMVLVIVFIVFSGLLLLFMTLSQKKNQDTENNNKETVTA